MATGMDMLELDCQITKDKEIVVAHDNHLLRVTGVDAKISELEFKVRDTIRTRQSVFLELASKAELCHSRK